MAEFLGAIAQLGEHLLCKQRVGGSIPPGSTIELYVGANLFAKRIAAKAAPTSNLDVPVMTEFRYLFFKKSVRCKGARQTILSMVCLSETDL